MTDLLATIQATAKQTQERHYCYDRGVRWACGGCEQDHPCEDFVAAGVVLDAATQLAERIDLPLAADTLRYYAAKAESSADQAILYTLAAAYDEGES